MLEMEAVTLRYGVITALHDVSLTVAPGEIVGLIGLNGAGKSSTLLAAAGSVPLAAGRVLVDAVALSRVRSEARVRQGIALVPESRRIFTTMTVEENLRMGAVARRDRRAARAEIERWMERFPDLGRFRGARAGVLSGGQQQQLAIARSLMVSPKYLLLDEPSLGLAPSIVDSIFELIADMRRDGIGVLLVDQMVHRVLELADRSYVISKGRITAEGDQHRIFPALQEAGLAIALGKEDR